MQVELELQNKIFSSENPVQINEEQSEASDTGAEEIGVLQYSNSTTLEIQNQ